MEARLAAPVLAVLLTACQTQAPPAGEPTAEAKAYLKNLAFSEVELKATEAFSGHQVVEVLGRITNNGQRPIRSIEVFCIFYDAYGQIVLRERQAIVRGRDGEFTTGRTRAFRLAFDSLPESWNQALPQLVIAHIEFA